MEGLGTGLVNVTSVGCEARLKKYESFPAIALNWHNILKAFCSQLFSGKCPERFSPSAETILFRLPSNTSFLPEQVLARKNSGYAIALPTRRGLHIKRKAEGTGNYPTKPINLNDCFCKGLSVLYGRRRSAAAIAN